MLRWLFGKWMRAAAAEAEGLLGPGAVVLSDETANFFGLESRGPAQIRGNGFLGLSDDELVFVMWLPRRTIRIPRASMSSIDRPRSHLGKTVGHPLLKILFTNAEGQTDSAAWLVRDLGAWEATLGLPAAES